MLPSSARLPGVCILTDLGAATAINFQRLAGPACSTRSAYGFNSVCSTAAVRHRLFRRRAAAGTRTPAFGIIDTPIVNASRSIAQRGYDAAEKVFFAHKHVALVDADATWFRRCRRATLPRSTTRFPALQHRKNGGAAQPSPRAVPGLPLSRRALPRFVEPSAACAAGVERERGREALSGRRRLRVVERGCAGSRTRAGCWARVPGAWTYRAGPRRVSRPS